MAGAPGSGFSGIIGVGGIAKAQDAMYDRLDKVLRALVLETVARLVTKTPVDTGRARANWIVDTKIAPSGGTDETDKAGAGTVSAALAKVKSYKFGGPTVYITNGLPYIEALEKGHSKQAPVGMVAVTVEELKVIAGGIVQEIKAGKGV